MDILGTARRLEAVLSKQLDRAAERVRTPGPLEPLEAAHAMVEAVARHVQPGGRGRYVFPYHRVKITIAAPTKNLRAELAAVIDGEPSLSDRMLERLASAGCDAANLDVRVAYVAAAKGTGRTRRSISSCFVSTCRRHRRRRGQPRQRLRWSSRSSTARQRRRATRCRPRLSTWAAAPTSATAVIGSFATITWRLSMLTSR